MLERGNLYFIVVSTSPTLVCVPSLPPPDVGFSFEKLHAVDAVCGNNHREYFNSNGMTFIQLYGLDKMQRLPLL